MKAELNWMLKDLKETHKRLSVDDLFITYVVFSVAGGILAIANIYIFIVMTFALYSYWYFVAYRHCKEKSRTKKEVDRLFNDI